MSGRYFLVCGDRNWEDILSVYTILSALRDVIPRDNIVIVHGAAPGADTIGGEVATDLGYEVKEYPADWGYYGRAAGPIRNKQMLDENPKIEKVFAFHNNLDESKGTKNMIEKAMERSIPVVLINHKGKAKKLEANDNARKSKVRKKGV